MFRFDKRALKRHQKKNPLKVLLINVTCEWEGMRSQRPITELIEAQEFHSLAAAASSITLSSASNAHG